MIKDRSMGLDGREYKFWSIKKKWSPSSIRDQILISNIFVNGSLMFFNAFKSEKENATNQNVFITYLKI